MARSLVPRFEWHDGEIYKYRSCPICKEIGWFNKGFMYGEGIFEGIRAYWNPQLKNLFVFRLRDHFQRMVDNATGIMDFSVPYTVDELMEATLELLRKEKFRTNVYLRPIIFIKDSGIGVDGENSSVVIGIVPFEKYNLNNDGGSISVRIGTWRRADNSMLPPKGKITGLYVQSHRIKKEARKSGYNDAIFLNADGTISEGSAANIMLVLGRVIFTPSADCNILEGITRKTLMQLVREELHILIYEAKMPSSKLFRATELFFCGTGAEIEPISSINKTHVVGNGEVGPITRKLQKVYFDVVYGRNPKYSDWLTPVYPVRNLP